MTITFCFVFACFFAIFVCGRTMLKKNIAIVALATEKAKQTSKIIAKKLGLVFIDTNDIVASLLNQSDLFQPKLQTLKNANEELLAKIKTLKQTIIFCNFELLSGANNLKKLKDCAIILYLKYCQASNLKDDSNYNLGYAFDVESKFCEQNADITIEVNSKTTTDDILFELKQFIDKGEFV